MNSLNIKQMVSTIQLSTIMIMKKHYINPAAESLYIRTGQLLTESITDVGGDGPGYEGGGHGGGVAKERNDVSDEEIQQLMENEGSFGQLW